VNSLTVAGPLSALIRWNT
jgi:hypothetical protein